MNVAPGPARNTAAAAISSGLRDPAERIVRFLRERLRRGRFRAEHRRIGRAGRDRVDQDVRRELARPGARHREHAALRGAVDRAVLAAEIGKLRGDVDDAPGPLRAPSRGAPRGRPGRRRGGSRRSAGRNPPRVVSSSGFSIRMPALLTRMSRPPSFVQRRLEESQHLRLVGDVGLHREGSAAIRFDRRRRPCRLPASARDRRSPHARPRRRTRSRSPGRCRSRAPVTSARFALERAHQTIVSPRSTLTAWPVMFFA